MIPFVINTPSPPTDIANFHSHACLPIDPRPEVPEPLPDPVNDQRYAISKSLISRIPIADYAGSNLISTKINK